MSKRIEDGEVEIPLSFMQRPDYDVIELTFDADEDPEYPFMLEMLADAEHASAPLSRAEATALRDALTAFLDKPQ